MVFEDLIAAIEVRIIEWCRFLDWIPACDTCPDESRWTVGTHVLSVSAGVAGIVVRDSSAQGEVGLDPYALEPASIDPIARVIARFLVHHVDNEKSPEP